MNRTPFLFPLALGGSVVGLAGACNGPTYPDLNPNDSYEAGSQAVGSGGGGVVYTMDAQVVGDAGTRDVSARDAPIDRVAPADAKKDTTVAPSPCPGCTLLATVGTAITSVALNLTNVSWTESGGSGAVEQVPRTGGASPMLLAGSLSNPLIVKTSDSYAVWSEQGSGPGTGTVSFLDFFPVSTPGMGLTAPSGVAVDASYAYWVSSAGGGITVQSAVLTSGATSTLGVAPGATLVAKGMAVNTSSIYFAASIPGGGGGIFELPVGGLDGGAPAEIWTGNATSQPVDVALDKTHVYWTDEGNGAVYKMPLGGGTLATVASKTTTSTIVGPEYIAVDSKRVYFSDTSGLYEVNIASSALTQLVTGLPVVGVAADDNDGNVYFSSGIQILSIAK